MTYKKDSLFSSVPIISICNFICGIGSLLTGLISIFIISLMVGAILIFVHAHVINVFKIKKQNINEISDSHMKFILNTLFLNKLLLTLNILVGILCIIVASYLTRWA